MFEKKCYENDAGVQFRGRVLKRKHQYKMKQIDITYSEQFHIDYGIYI